MDSLGKRPEFHLTDMYFFYFFFWLVGIERTSCGRVQWFGQGNINSK